MQATIITIVVACLPIFVLLYYFWHRDKGEKEPMRLMKKVFWAGVFVTIPVAIIEGIIDITVIDIFGNYPFWYFFVMPFLFIALPEELGKLWVVKKKAYHHRKFNEIMDGITYCILASMGFAILENIIYIVNYGIETGILRAFTAVPAHALFSGIMGFYIGLAKFAKDKDEEKSYFRKGLLAGVFFHGLYNFLLISGVPILIILVIPLIIYMWFILNRAICLANNGQMQPLKYF